jgi:hypothetical protein
MIPDMIVVVVVPLFFSCSSFQRMTVTGQAPEKHQPLLKVNLDDEKLFSVQQVLAKCVAACMNCAERAEDERMDCEKQCRACAEICSTSLKWLSMRFEMAPDLFRVTRRLCSNCRDLCRSHKFVDENFMILSLIS